MERKLAAIVAADVVGYSRLMGEDEAGTLAALKAQRADIIDPKVIEHGGRIIKLMGDGLLIEFASVVDAVQFAIDMQTAVAAANLSAGHDNGLRYRIGINIGDVIVDGDDIYGDGVNVAARLESLSDPGGISIARSVRDQIRDKLPLKLEDLGEVEVKNIARPVRTFRIVMDDSALALSTPVSPADLPKPLFPRKTVAVALAAVAAMLLLAIVAWRLSIPAIEPARVEAMALPLPDKPSIAVLPFANLSDDAGQTSFADGLTEDVITDLSKISGLFVIARNTMFTYRGQSVNVRNVAEDLGVRYVLDGSVRRSGDQLRVNATLIDAISGSPVWADRFDGGATDIFAVQDRFVLKIVNALQLKLTAQEQSDIERSDTRKIEAREEFQKGWELYSKFNARDNAAAVGHFERAVELDPEYGKAYGALALVYARAAFFGWFEALGLSQGDIYNSKIPPNLRKAREYPSSLMHVVEAMQHLFYWDHSEPEGSDRGTSDARIAAGKAIALQPNDPEAHIVMAWALIASGHPDEGLNFVASALRLNPSAPSHYVFFGALAHYADGRLDQAAEVLRDGLTRNPQALELAPLAVSIEAQLGNRETARELLRKWQADKTLFELAKAAGQYEFPVRWVEERHILGVRLRDGLQLAALPPAVTVSRLKPEIAGGNAFERLQAVRKLGWFGTRAAPAVADLVDALADAPKALRKEIAITLGKIGPEARTAVPALKSMEDEPIVGFHARTALLRIGGR